MTKSTFRQVSSMADDAITVRVKRTTDGYIGILDFPTFHTSNGTIVRASMIPAFPVREALLKAIKIQPSTPFLEVVVKLEEDVEWSSEWGTLLPDR